jgi:hypothetical protein
MFELGVPFVTTAAGPGAVPVVGEVYQVRGYQILGTTLYGDR